MNTDEIINGINKLLGQYDGPEIVLLEELDALAEGWRMRIAELEAEDEA